MFRGRREESENHMKIILRLTFVTLLLWITMLWSQTSSGDPESSAPYCSSLTADGTKDALDTLESVIKTAEIAGVDTKIAKAKLGELRNRKQTEDGQRTHNTTGEQPGSGHRDEQQKQYLNIATEASRQSLSMLDQISLTLREHFSADNAESKKHSGVQISDSIWILLITVALCGFTLFASRGAAKKTARKVLVEAGLL